MKHSINKIWAERDLWTVTEFAQLVFGYNPTTSDNPIEIETSRVYDEFESRSEDDYSTEYYTLLDNIRRSIIAKTLTVYKYPHKFSQAARPEDFIEWARKKSIKLPAWMEAPDSPKVIQRKQQTQEKYSDWCKQRSQLITSGVEKYIKTEGTPNELAIAREIAKSVVPTTPGHICKMIRKHCK